MLCFITNKKCTESSNILNIFIHDPLLMRDNVPWYFPGLCGVSDTTMWHSRHASLTTFPNVSLFAKGDDSAKTVPAPFCFWRTSFWPFFPRPKAVLIGFPREANISLEAAVGQMWFSVLCFPFSLTVPKHLDSCSTFLKADVTSSALSSHSVFRF